MTFRTLVGYSNLSYEGIMASWAIYKVHAYETIWTASIFSFTNMYGYTKF